MIKEQGLHIIPALRKKWMVVTVLADALIAGGLAFFLAILFDKLFAWPYGWGIVYFLFLFAILFFVHRVWRVKTTAIAQLLDQAYPQLEESTGLLLEPWSSLNVLERLQHHKIRQALSVVRAPLNITQKLLMPAGILAMLLASGMVLYNITFHQAAIVPTIHYTTVNDKRAKEKILPQITGVTVSITPPAYTGKIKRQQHAFNLVAEEGSRIDWQLQTSAGASRVKFIFNDALQILLHTADTGHTVWQLNKKMDSTGFYQVSINGQISELYKIETVKDTPPVITVQSPKQYTTIDFGEPQQVNINSTISDDYGINEATVTATIASGSGEAVKFKEQKILFPGFMPGRTRYSLQQSLSLTTLGMQPGDELYFYVQATDNHQQETRSGIYIVHLPDTARLMSLDGLANSLTLKPEYFRSQRQIIIETEQLLKDKDTLSKTSFENRSNNLGIDQKLLRLRYGKFLGDEEESGENKTAELGNISNFSNADKIRDAYTDKHDNAEDATFFEPGIKKQLKATLTEMWDAERRLRTFMPKDALPFEYKALRLLKDLQQQSRAYVAKTNFTRTPLDLKKRLTGDISKIDQSTIQQDIKQEPDLQLPVRNALAALEEIRLTGNTQNISIEILQKANLRLHEKAIQQPSRYLNAVAALKKIMDAPDTGQVPATDILLAEQGLQQLLVAPGRLPSAGSSSRQALSRQYFDNLKKMQP